MIRATSTISLDESELAFEFTRGAGPGGQNVNKVETAVRLRFDATRSPSLPEDVRARLLRLAANRLSADGDLVIEARRFRTQKQNREDAVLQLVELVRRAATPPKIRHKTRPTLESQRRRVEGKRRRSALKRLRRDGGRLDE